MLHYGYSVLVVTSSFGKKDHEFSIIEGVPVSRVKINVSRLPISLIVTVKNFKRADVVHVQALDLYGVLFVMLAKFLRKPIVLTTHQADVLPTRNRLYSFLKLLVLKFADIVTAVSFSTLKATIRIGADHKKALVIYNSVNELIFMPRHKKEVRRELNLDLNKKIILYVGYLTQRKNVQNLVDSIQLVLREFPDTILFIIGDGPKRKELELLVKRKHLEKIIRFMSNVPTTMLALYYNASDVFVLPSLDEGHSTVLLEAMASGLPLIATKVGGNIETVVDSKNGFLIEPSDSKALSERIKVIFTDEALARDFGEKSNQMYIERFSEVKQLEAFNRVYSSIIMKTKRNLIK